jgi:hypothetical protein
MIPLRKLLTTRLDTRIVGVVFVVILYVISLGQPAFTVVLDEPGVVYGWLALKSILYCGPSEAGTALLWMPNGLLLVGVVCLLRGHWRAALLASLLALLGGLQLPCEVAWGNGSTKFFAGYYLWMASMAVLAIFSLLEGGKQSRRFPAEGSVPPPGVAARA